MASRILHFAIAQSVIDSGQVKDKDRFLFGTLLPDAYAGTAKHKSHLHVILPSGKRTYDLDDFKHRFSRELETDELYRGYYLHLVEDLIFRDLIYNVHGWNPRTPGNIARLHRDYELINAHAIEKYGLSRSITVPDGIETERISELCQFDTDALVKGLYSDFETTVHGKYFFFTPEMADEFVAVAAKAAKKELSALDIGGKLTDMLDYTWG